MLSQSPAAADLRLLFELLAIPAPSGREAPVADRLESLCRELPEVAVERIADLVFARKGTPRTAMLAHTDTTGFTLGYDGGLIPIGTPEAKAGDALRPVDPAESAATVRLSGETLTLSPPGAGRPGGAWVFARAAERDGEVLTAPYLDNRAGVWSAFQALARAPEALAVFTTGEEHSGRGALVAARVLYEQYGISRAIISDITWHTQHVRCGSGVAVSLRDRFVPRQAFLDRALAIADASGIPFQREIESAGSSDGGYIECSGYPIDWVFVGAPEKHPHTARESLDLRDLQAMVDLSVLLVREL